VRPTDEQLDELATSLIPILNHAAEQATPLPKDGNQYEDLRAEYAKKVAEDPGFWESVKSSTRTRITTANRSTK
jgi:hypothetical protein